MRKKQRSGVELTVTFTYGQDVVWWGVNIR